MSNKKIQLKDKDGNNLYPAIVKQCILDIVYPIGSIYMSMNNTNPQDLFGGTWEAIKGRFLLGTGAPDNNSNTWYGTDLTYNGSNKYAEALGSTGGASRHNHTTQGHTLTIAEMPQHTHDYGLSGGSYSGRSGNAKWDNTTYQWWPTNYAGGNQPHSHGDTGVNFTMPPYMVVNMWKRTA